MAAKVSQSFSAPITQPSRDQVLAADGLDQYMQICGILVKLFHEDADFIARGCLVGASAFMLPLGEGPAD